VWRRELNVTARNSHKNQKNSSQYSFLPHKRF
jgi:hypothetical protein